MLKRRRRIRKIINAVKRKQLKKGGADLLKYKLEEQDDAISERLMGGVSLTKHDVEQEEEGTNCWRDSDDEKELHLPAKNALRKLQLGPEHTHQQYESKLRKFWSKKVAANNWAVEGEGQEERDLFDDLNQEEIYEQGIGKDSETRVQFFSRSHEKHDSVVTGLDWHNRVLFTTGLDQKLKVWSVHPQEDNPDLKIVLQKDIFASKLPLTSCFYSQGQLYCGSLRKNYLVVDCHKWSPRYVTSTFLSEHASYKNLRVRRESGESLLFSQRRISLLDSNGCYLGGLQASQELTDVTFGKEHQLIGVSNNCLYEWDLRTYKAIHMQRKCLAFTKVTVCDDVLATGNKLGIVQLSKVTCDAHDQRQYDDYSEVSNLVTYVTEMKTDPRSRFLLAMSRWKPNAARLINIHKGKCIPNWPNVKTKVGFGICAGFSSSDQLAIGSSHGYATIYNLLQGSN